MIIGHEVKKKERKTNLPISLISVPHKVIKKRKLQTNTADQMTIGDKAKIQLMIKYFYSMYFN